jgi:hypothetical protein
MNAYAAVPHAVAFVELILCAADDGESAWDVMTAAGLSPAEVSEQCRLAVGDADAIPADRRAAVLVEMGHPQFARYVAGKMGAM